MLNILTIEFVNGKTGYMQKMLKQDRNLQHILQNMGMVFQLMYTRVWKSSVLTGKKNAKYNINYLRKELNI